MTGSTGGNYSIEVELFNLRMFGYESIPSLLNVGLGDITLYTFSYCHISDMLLLRILILNIRYKLSFVQG